MVNRKMVYLLAGIFILSAAFYISASTAFVALLLGFLFVPPVVMIGAALVQGASELSNEFFKPEKESMVISV